MEHMLGLIPMKRFGTLDEIAGWVAVLASDVADFMTGAISLLTAGIVSFGAAGPYGGKLTPP